VPVSESPSEMATAVGEATGAGVLETVSSRRLQARRKIVNRRIRNETRFMEIICVETRRYS
jgi:hypothetical protein